MDTQSQDNVMSYSNASSATNTEEGPLLKTAGGPIISSSTALEEQFPPITYKEIKALKKARYDKIIADPRFKNTYVLKNKKTGQMAEIKAASPCHACNIIGWKLTQVKLIEKKEIKEDKEVKDNNPA